MSYMDAIRPNRHAQMFALLHQSHRAEMVTGRHSVAVCNSDEDAEALRFQRVALMSFVRGLDGPVTSRPSAG